MDKKRLTLLSNIIDNDVSKHQYMIARYLNDPSFDLRSTNECNYFNYGYSFAQDNDLHQPANVNVIKSAIDTLVSKISNQKCRPYFSSINGTYKTRQVVRQAQQFFDYVFDEENVNHRVSHAFRSACICGSGHIFLNPFTYKLEVLEPWTVAVQHTEEAYGCPTDMLVKFNNYPTSLIEDYKDKYDYVQYCIYISVKEHKAYKIINAKEVEVKKYEPDVLPLVTINYCDPVFGRKTTSIVEELNGIQTQIDMINQKIAAASQLTPANSVYVLEGSSLDAEKLTNKSGEVYQIKLPPGMNSLPVQQVTPAPFDPMWQSMLDHYIKIAFETIGLSQLSATGKKPAGVDSGVALSTLEDVESDRFETQLNAFIKMYTDIAKMYINVLPANADIVPVSQNTSPLKWKDLLKEQGLFKVQYSAATFLSKQPSEKIKQISQLSQAGLIGVEKISQLLDNPDLEDAYSFAQAVHNACNKVIEATMDGEEVDIPKFISYEQLAKDISQTQNQLYASLSGDKGDKEINEQIDNLTKLEDRLYDIMDKEGFIQSDKLEGPQGSKEGLQVNNQVGGAASIADELANPMNGSAPEMPAPENMAEVEPNEDLANGQEAMPAPTMG